MAAKEYRIEAVDHRGRRARTTIRDRAHVTLTRLEDGRVLEITMMCRQRVGRIVTLEDDQVNFGLWQP